MFAELGYPDASIVKLTEAAGVGQGTFYLYFTSKKQIFDELVLDLNAHVRHAMTEAAAPGKTRAEKERLGFAAFFRFTAEHPALYRIMAGGVRLAGDAAATLRAPHERLRERSPPRDGGRGDRGRSRAACLGADGHRRAGRHALVLWAGQDELAPELSQELGRIITRTLGAREDGQ